MKIYLLLLIALFASGRAHAAPQVAWKLTHEADLPYDAVLAADEHRLYLGYSGGFYMSRGPGLTFRLTLPDRHVTPIGVGKNAVYAGTLKHGLYRSDSGGVTWENNSVGIDTFDNGPFVDERRYAEVNQILVTRSGTAIACKYHAGTYISTNRGEWWKSTYNLWRVPGNFNNTIRISHDIWSMTETGGYWWAATTANIVRSPDKGKTWQSTKNFKFTRIDDWQEFNGRLYVIRHVFGRWNEDEHNWEYFSEGLPPSPESTHFTSLAVHRGRLFAGDFYSGVYLFDDRSDTFVSVGLQDSRIVDIVSHNDYLYAAVMEDGIYRADIQIVQPYGKAATTWGALKTE